MTIGNGVKNSEQYCFPGESKFKCVVYFRASDYSEVISPGSIILPILIKGLFSVKGQVNY
jgi:hypothetical protein